MIDNMTAGQILTFVYDNAWARAALLLICADILSGVALALYTREFRLARIGEFLLSRAVPYLLGAGVVELVVYAMPGDALLGLDRSTVAGGAWLFAILSLVGHVFGNLRQMGIPIPAVLGDDDRIRKASIAPVLLLAAALSACAHGTPAGPIASTSTAAVMLERVADAQAAITAAYVAHRIPATVSDPAMADSRTAIEAAERLAFAARRWHAAPGGPRRQAAAADVERELVELERAAGRIFDRAYPDPELAATMARLAAAHRADAATIRAATIKPGAAAWPARGLAWA